MKLQKGQIEVLQINFGACLNSSLSSVRYSFDIFHPFVLEWICLYHCTLEVCSGRGMGGGRGES